MSPKFYRVKGNSGPWVNVLLDKPMGSSLSGLFLCFRPIYICPRFSEPKRKKTTLCFWPTL